LEPLATPDQWFQIAATETPAATRPQQRKGVEILLLIADILQQRRADADRSKGPCVPTPLCVLILEDNLADAEQLAAELCRAGFALNWRRVASEQEYLAALEIPPDLILADHTLSRFDAIQALQLLHMRRLDIPLIVVAGSVDEEAAVECLRMGAADYLLKDRLARLGPAIVQALDRQQLRAYKRATEVTVQSGVALDRAVISSLVVQIAVLDQHGLIVTVNKAWERFARENNDPLLARTAAGDDYLAACRAAGGEGARRIVAGIEVVLAGAQGHFMTEYLCQAPAADRWFELHVTPLDGGAGVVLAYEDITTHKQMELVLRERKERFRSAFEYAVIGMALVGVDGRWLQVNQVLCDITGYAEHELLATTYQAITHPDHHETDRVRIQRVLAGEIHSYQIEKRYISKNGEVIWVLLTSSLVRDDRNRPLYFISQIQDITARKQADEVRAQLAAIVDSSNDSVISSTLDGMILTWNAGAERLYQYTPTEAIGGSVRMLLPPDRPGELAQLVARINRGERITNYETVRMRKDGQPVDVAFTISPIKDEQGVIIGISAFTRDISERTRARQALHRQTTFVKLLQAVAVAANQASSIEAAMQTAVEQICMQIGWPLGHVYLVRDDAPEALASTDIWYLADLDRFAVFRTTTAARARSTGDLPGQVLISGKPGWIADMTAAPDVPTAEPASTIGVRAAFAFPVLLGTEVVAVLEFFSVEVIEPDEALLDVMAHVGTQLGRVVERVRAEAALRRSEQLYRTVASNFPNGALLLFDRDLRYTVAGGTGLAEVGLTREQLEGKTIHDLFPPDLCEQLMPAHYTALVGSPSVLEVLYAGLTHLVYTIPVRDEPGEVYAGMVMTQNITERKRFEEALVEERALLARRVEERTADLSAANAELARAARLKDEFLASMSHELRTPLNAVLGLSEALQEQVYGPLNATQLKALKSVEESGRHLLDLINDILDLAKIGAGKLDLAFGPVAPGAICQASLRLIKHDAHKKHLRIETTIDPAVALLRADARRLKQVLVNLLSNAVKFTSEGGTVGLEVVGDMAQQVVRLTVWDSGIGIAEEDLPRLFQPFVQLDSRLARQYNGTGLGLALVYRMVEMHGGSVSVTSEPGVGSRFTISLPWYNQAGTVEPCDATLSPAAATAALPTIRQALIIEDSPTAAAQLVRYLGELGVTAVTHPQGEDAITRVLEVRPDLIILDILLPDTSGWEVLERLQVEPRTRQIPVLIVSVMDDRSYGLALGAADYLVKPFTRQDVQQVLGRLGPPSENDSHLAPQALPDQASMHLTVLLAEDNEVSITTMLDYLCAKGYQVVVARNGAEAITRAREVQPAIILMDIQMPGMDGLEAIRRIRMQRNVAQTPIIALTALAMPGDRERCLAAGADDYLSKPVSLKGLTMAIEAQLQECLARQGDQ
jgi:PAS domain S-box-containing protein